MVLRYLRSRIQKPEIGATAILPGVGLTGCLERSYPCHATSTRIGSAPGRSLFDGVNPLTGVGRLTSSIRKACENRPQAGQPLIL